MVPVPDARHAERERVPDGIGSLRVARVACHRNMQLARQVKYGPEIAQRHNALRAGKIRAHYALSQKVLRQPHGLKIFFHIDRFGPNAHRAKKNPRIVVRMLGQRLPAPLQDRFDGLPLREPRALVKLRRKADLIVNVSLPGEYR